MVTASFFIFGLYTVFGMENPVKNKKDIVDSRFPAPENLHKNT